MMDGKLHFQGFEPMAKPAAKTPAKAGSLILLKVTLNDIRPAIWRRISLPGSTSLGDLHLIIQAAMGWDCSHLHAFQAAGRDFGDPFDLEDAEDEEDMTIDGLVRLGVSRFLYTYDFGDNWEHTLLIEKKQPPADAPAIPTCLAGSRNCPPEDCGGAPGYDELLAALAAPDSPDSRELLEMIGEGFDLEEFSIEKTNARMAGRLGGG
jgi:hypothetical protein